MYVRIANRIVLILLVFIITMSFSSCVGKTVVSDYQKISASEAKSIIDTEKDFVILDVRTQSEFSEYHIENAILIPDNEIDTKAESMLKNKDQLILVYCRTGRRSALASKELAKLGYTNVKDFGGIVDWPYDTVKEN